jgi:hypothetical protein
MFATNLRGNAQFLECALLPTLPPYRSDTSINFSLFAPLPPPPDKEVIHFNNDRYKELFFLQKEGANLSHLGAGQQVLEAQLIRAGGYGKKEN